MLQISNLTCRYPTATVPQLEPFRPDWPLEAEVVCLRNKPRRRVVARLRQGGATPCRGQGSRHRWHSEDETALSVSSFALGAEEHAIILGASGYGEPTLLHLIVGILKARQGTLRFANTSVASLSARVAGAWRGKTIGFLPQSLALAPSQPARKNLLPSAYANGWHADDACASALLDEHVMRPLEPGEKLQPVLLSLAPRSCTFCLPAGLKGEVAVTSKTPIKYTFEPVAASGKMTVSKDDPMDLNYRLTDAVPLLAK